MASSVKAIEGFQWLRLSRKAKDGFSDSPLNPIKTLINSSEEYQLAPIEIPQEMSDAQVKELHWGQQAPLVLRGRAKSWRACSQWTLDFLAESYQDHRVPVAGEEGETVSLAEAVKRTRQGEKVYSRFSPLITEHPELLDDLDLETICNVSGANPKQVLFQLFIGGEGTRTETHCAVGNNVFTQLHGRKVWRLVAPHFTANLGPLPLGRPYFASLAELDKAEFISEMDLVVHEVVLEEGDILLVPPFWWHQVDNLSDSIGLATRWHSLRHALRQSRFLSLATLLANNPNIVQANKDRAEFGFVYQSTVRQAKGFE